MIDLHSHILWGVDDGARTPADSVEIARAAVEDGIEAVAATPHVRDDYPTEPEAMEERLRELRSLLAREGVPLEVLPGGEVALERLSRPPEELRRFGLGGNPRYLLVETPSHGWPAELVDALARLLERRIVPVLAHPERNAEVQRRPELLSSLVRAGILVQVTAASVDGRLGRRAQSCALRLIERRLAHMLASDAHHAAVRAVGLRSAVRALRDDALGEWLVLAVPGAVVRDLPLPPRPVGTRRGGLLRTLFTVED